jgi:glucosamine--fructose-6-phosphate aminotransferase (isomerizing)
MCGIVGYIGKKNCLPILIKGLKRLEYRGYDSAGIAYLKNNNIKISKTTGRINDLEKIINTKDKSLIGIGHTRWATHGGVDDINSHPHQVGNITIVHNGIIENYQELKNILTNEGYNFKSETDTEVACAYIDYEYQKSKTKDMLDILDKCMNTLKGSFAITIIVKNITDKLYVIKKDSPLVIGLAKDENYVASDISAFIDDTTGYIILEDMEIGIITKDKVSIYKNKLEIQKEIKHISYDYSNNDKHGYEHYMLKEIHEQSSVIAKLNKLYLKDLKNLPDINKYNKIHIIGCGTAYHAGMIGKYLIENYSDFEVNVYIASEYRYQKIFVDKNTLVIAASQSGETADTIACLKKAQEYGCKTLGIVNVKDSSIARLVDNVIYTKAGPEVAVASTKAYTSQAYIFSLLALKLGITKNLIKKEDILLDYQKLPTLIEKMININYNDIIEKFWNDSDVFYLGRNIDYISVLEGSLKLKEISYIHSEAYQAGELKHGTISLIEKNTCVIALITKDEITSKTISNIKEVKARGAYVVLLIKNTLNTNIDKSCYDKLIPIDTINSLLQPILNVIPLQLIAYNVAKKRGCDIDKPRNLAKSVTVE